MIKINSFRVDFDSNSAYVERTFNRYGLSRVHFTYCSLIYLANLSENGYLNFAQVFEQKNQVSTSAVTILAVQKRISELIKIESDKSLVVTGDWNTREEKRGFPISKTIIY